MEVDEARLLVSIEAHDIEAAVALLRSLANASPGLGRVRSLEGYPLVALAIRLDQPEVLDLLLNLGCACQEYEVPEDTDVDQYHEDPYHGSSPLCLAVEFNRVDCARVLIAHGASVDARARADRSLQTPLHVIAMHNRHDACFRDELLASSIDVNATDMADDTPLNLATCYNAYETAQQLLEIGADPRFANACRSTPLHVAAVNAFDVMAGLYIRQSVDIDARDTRGNTPLLDAAFAGQHDMTTLGWQNPEERETMAKLLLAHGANANAENRDGNTAIFGAVWNGYGDAAVVLLGHGASVAKPNRNGETVHDVAARATTLSNRAREALLETGTSSL